jgi:predicted nucleic acid-binding protein
MTGERPQRGLLDTNILILLRWMNGAELAAEMAISAVTLAELSAGRHEVRSNDEQGVYDERAERARHMSVLQRADLDPIPFDAEAARIYGQVSGARNRDRVQATGQGGGPHDRLDRYRGGPGSVHH